MLELLREHGIGDKIEKKVSGAEEIMQRDSHIDRHLIYGKGSVQIFTIICSELIDYLCGGEAEFIEYLCGKQKTQNKKP